MNGPGTRILFWRNPPLWKGILHRTIVLCVILLLLTSCTAPAAAQLPTLPASATAEPVEDSATPTAAATPLPPTPLPLPTLPDDFDPVDFFRASSLEVAPLPAAEGMVHSAPGMLLIIYPLVKDAQTGAYQYDREHDLTLLRLPPGMLLGTGEQYALRAPSAAGQTGTLAVQVAVLPHLVGSQPYLGLVLLSAGIHDLTTRTYQAQQFYAETAPAGILAEATYFGGRDTYPNKLTNILIALAYMAEYQSDNGPFQARDGYSFNQIIRLRGGDTLRYADGADQLWASGVCAVASLTSASLYQLSQHLGVDYIDSLSAIIRTQYQHKIAAPYASSPYLPVEVDTVVAVLPDMSADLVWQMPPEPAETFLRMDAAVIPNLVAFEDTAADGIGGLADAELLVTLAFTGYDPGPQAAPLQSRLSAYRLFRTSQHAEVQEDLLQGQMVAYPAWEDDAWLAIAQGILPLD